MHIATICVLLFSTSFMYAGAFPLPEHITLLRSCRLGLQERIPADELFQKLLPLHHLTPCGSIPLHELSRAQSKAWSLLAQAYKNEDKKSQELTCLFNELAVSWNNRCLISDKTTYRLPSYHTPTLRRLCRLSAEEWLAAYVEDNGPNALQKKFFATLCRSIQALNVPAIDTIHAIIEQRKQSDYLLTQFNAPDDSIKCASAYALSKIVRATDPQLADAYLRTAASGYFDACPEALRLAHSEPDITKAADYFEIAAQANPGDNREQQRLHKRALIEAARHHAAIITADPEEKKYHKIKALTYFSRAAATYNAAEARLNLALASGSNIPETVRLLTQLIKNPAFVQDAKGKPYQRALYHLGNLYRNRANRPLDLLEFGRDRKQEYKEALDYLFKSAQSGYKPAQTAYPNVLIERAESAETRERAKYLDRAEQFIQTLLQKNPAYAMGLAQLGLIQLHRKNRQEDRAIKTLLKAFRLQPKDIAILEVFSSAFIFFNDAKQFDRFRQLAQGMIAIDPACGLALANEGHMLFDIDNDTQAARSYFKRAGKNGFGPSFKSLGITYLYSKSTPDYRKAIKYLKMAQHLCPDDNELFFLLGDCHHFLNEHKEALVLFSEGADHNNLQCREVLAKYAYLGVAGPPNFQAARDHFGVLVIEYALKNDMEKKRMAEIMISLVTFQNPNYAGNIDQAIEIVKAFPVKKWPWLTAEALYTVAALYKRRATTHSASLIHKDDLLSALELLDLTPDARRGQVLKAEIGLELITRGLIDPEKQKEQELQENLADIIIDQIEKLQRERPFGHLLVRARDICFNYAFHLFKAEGMTEKALNLFTCAATHGSWNAQLQLYKHYATKDDHAHAERWITAAAKSNPTSIIVQRCLREFETSGS